MKVPVANRNKILTKMIDDIYPKVRVSNSSEGLSLKMSKWDVTVTHAVNDAFFEPAETDYRDSVMRKLYKKFAEAMNVVEDTDHEPATPLEHKPYTGAGIPAPHELTVEDLKQDHADVLEEAKELAEAEQEHELDDIVPPNLQEMTVNQAKEIVELIDNPEVLKTMLVQEKDGKDRKGVKDALEAALEEFAE